MLLIEDMVKNFLFIDICYIGKVLFSIKNSKIVVPKLWNLFYVDDRLYTASVHHSDQPGWFGIFSACKFL